MTEGDAVVHAASCSYAMSSAPGHFAIIFGTLVGGAIGFYVVHQLEERHKESIRAAIAQRDAEIRQESNSFNSSKVNTRGG